MEIWESKQEEANLVLLDSVKRQEVFAEMSDGSDYELYGKSIEQWKVVGQFNKLYVNDLQRDNYNLSLQEQKGKSLIDFVVMHYKDNHLLLKQRKQLFYVFSSFSEHCLALVEGNLFVLYMLTIILLNQTIMFSVKDKGQDSAEIPPSIHNLR